MALLRVDIVGDASKLQRSVSGVESSVSKLRGTVTANLREIGAGFAAAFGAKELVSQAADAIRAASDLSETISKTGQVFGSSSGAILDWSKNSSNAFGMSRQQALDAAASFAVFGKSAGLQGAPLNTFSTSLTSLAADFASFANTSPEEAITSIGAALRGETEPIRKYGLTIDQASIQNQAFRMGLIKTAKTQVTPQQRILAVQALVKSFADGQKITGDFARTSGGLANQQRILAAKVENAKAAIGAALVPAMLLLIGAATDVGRAIQAVIGWFQKNMDVIKPLVIFFGALALIMSAQAIVTGIAGAALAAYRIVMLNARVAALLFNAAIRANPIGAIITLIMLLAAVFIVLYQRNETFRNIVLAVWAAVQNAISAAWPVIKAVFDGLATNVRALIAVVRFLAPVFSAIFAVVSAVVRANVAIISAIITVLIAVFRAVPGLIRGALSLVGAIITAPFRLGVAGVRAIVGGIGGAFKGVAGAVASAVAGVFGALIGPFQRAWSWIQSNILSPIRSAWNGIAGVVNRASFEVEVPSNKLTKALHLDGLGFRLGLPKLPMLAAGGWVTAPTLALVGEGRSAEVVAPEPMLRQILREELAAGSVSVTVNGALDPDAVARQIEHLLTQRARRVGGVTRAGSFA